MATRPEHVLTSVIVQYLLKILLCLEMASDLALLYCGRLKDFKMILDVNDGIERY